MLPQVSVLILNWNGRRFLQDCLESFQSQTCKGFEVILVDNGSSDGSAELVRSCYPWVTLVELPENVGFAEGNNRGLAACRGDFIVTLNNDTVVDADFLTALVAATEGNPAVGMVAPKMMNYFHRDILDSMGLKVARNGLGYNVGVAEKDEGQYDGPMEVFGPCGGAALYRRGMLEAVGFFDPDFFAYYEDFDLAWRGRLVGWECVTAPRAVVYHVHSATSGEMSAFKVYHTHRNKWFSIIKNWPLLLIVANAPWLLLYDLAALLFALVNSRGGAALRARLDVFGALATLFRKRHSVQRTRSLTVDEIRSLFSAFEHPLRTFIRKRASLRGAPSGK